ncbi:LysR family transcriptional regulator [Vibrio sinaloensis]|uniref:LysR family transcriptional regulator n=1 Tax=Photobacterium sp. (strain ATCC 43367) TaxID=379097 RepID=UPI0020633597|nr:LysR family transcriptional regulator [Vibrio sinaloensis]UPQ89461.1 LysR family transcriptional regulator [Vibrio sinaloensis]
MISYNQMKAFLTVVEVGSMSKAAKRLYCSQSTVSRLIEQLEDETGLQLFERDFSSKRLSLTESGQAIQTKCQQTLTGLEEFESFCHGLSAGVEAEMTLAIPQLFQSHQLQRMLSKLFKAFPNTQFSFVEPSINTIVRLVEQKKVDFAFNITTYEYGHGVDFLGIQELRACMVVAQDSPLATLSRASIADLEQHRHVTFRQLSNRKVEGLNFSKHVIEADTIHQQLSLLAPTAGYAVIPESMYQSFKDVYGLARLHSEVDSRLVYSCHAMYPQNNLNKPVNQWLVNYIKEHWQ